MRKFHVKVYFAHAKGDGFVESDESVITFVRSYEVNGVFVSEDWADLIFQPFGQLHLRPPTEGRRPWLVELYQRLLDSLTEDDWLEETAGNSVVIPVSTFEFIEGVWFENQHPVESHDPAGV